IAHLFNCKLYFNLISLTICTFNFTLRIINIAESFVTFEFFFVEKLLHKLSHRHIISLQYYTDLKLFIRVELIKFINNKNIILTFNDHTSLSFIGRHTYSVRSRVYEV